MPVVGRLDQYASMLATEFDDYSMSENLVTDTATDYNYSFNNQIVATANDVAPDGTTVLCKHNLTGGTQPFLNCRANTTLSAGQTYTMSMYLKGTTNFSASFAFVGETTNEIYSNTANITTAWQRFTLTFTLIATQNLSRLQLFFATQGEGKIVSVWGAQLETGSVATDYTTRRSGTQVIRVLPATTNTNITGLGTYYSSGFDENVGFTTFLSANVFAPYDPVYDEFGGTLFGAGQGRYMRHNTDKSVVVYNEIDEIGLTPSCVISPSTTSVNEGSSVIFSVTATNVENETTLYYDITGSVGIASTDFTNSSLSGSLSVSGTFDLGYGSTTLTLSNDTFTEGTETFKMNVRTGSTSGTIVGISPIITILDTSLDPDLFAFTSFTFTNGTATGSSGPTSFASVSSYTTSTWYSSYFSVASGIQSWTVPANGTYRINAVGASGGENNGGTFYPGRPGQGATIQGDFVLTKGTVLNLVVGQKGVYGANGSGGGGGSFVYTGSIGGGGLLIAAGGGGGWGHGSSSYTTGTYGGGGSATTTPVSGTASPSPPDNGYQALGSGGNGGAGTLTYGTGGGGAGWGSNGNNGTSSTYNGGGGSRWVGGTPNGSGAGATNTGQGGFGGGGGWGGDNGAAGGGGGYTGGGGANGYNGISWGAGAGGGSYNSGSNQVNTAGTTGQSSGWSHGSITITKL